MMMINSKTRRRGGWNACMGMLSVLVCLLAGTQAIAAERSHGLTIHGDLKYPPDFEHFDYASPDAVKGGTMTLDAFGTYDSVNPFILKGRQQQRR